jgi:hypothetical protein
MPGGPSILPLESPLRHGEDLGCSVGKMPGNDRTLPREEVRGLLIRKNLQEELRSQGQRGYVAALGPNCPPRQFSIGS